MIKVEYFTITRTINYDIAYYMGNSTVTSHLVKIKNVEIGT